jgi:hypothetical protein
MEFPQNEGRFIKNLPHDKDVRNRQEAPSVGLLPNV